MGILVVANFLLLLRDIDSNLDGLCGVSKSSIEFKSVLWLFGHIVSLPHQVINKFVSQSVKLGLCNHVNHVRNAGVSFLNVKLKSFVELFRFLIVLGCSTPLGFAFIVLSDSQMFIVVPFINL